MTPSRNLSYSSEQSLEMASRLRKMKKDKVKKVNRGKILSAFYAMLRKLDVCSKKTMGKHRV
jgi:hypothetical protein